MRGVSKEGWVAHRATSVGARINLEARPREICQPLLRRPVPSEQVRDRTFILQSYTSLAGKNGVPGRDSREGS
jgi:hypothetical protein